jgi:hypothetical protein
MQRGLLHGMSILNLQATYKAFVISIVYMQPFSFWKRYVQFTTTTTTSSTNTWSFSFLLVLTIGAVAVVPRAFLFFLNNMSLIDAWEEEEEDMDEDWFYCLYSEEGNHINDAASEAHSTITPSPI